MGKTTPNNVHGLKENEVFVFGSNAEGNHAEKFVTGKIGENGLKENIWYSLDESGNFIEIK